MVGLREDVKNRMYEYVNAQNPRPVIADVASLAVTRYLDEQENRA